VGSAIVVFVGTQGMLDVCGGVGVLLLKSSELPVDFEAANRS
jgi:hypothetical protein